VPQHTPLWDRDLRYRDRDRPHGDVPGQATEGVVRAVRLHPPPDLVIVEEARPERRLVPERARKASPGGEDRGALAGLVTVMKHEARHAISVVQTAAADIG
jgi:hypothetical protein